MKIGTKLMVALAIPLTALIALFGWLEEQNNRARSQTELAREGRAIARAVQLAMQYALRDQQVADVRHLIDQTTGYESVLAIRLFNPDGTLSYQSPSFRNYPPVPPDAIRRAIEQRRLVQTRLTLGDQPLFAYIAPLLSPEGVAQGAVEILQVESFIEEDARASRRAIAAFTGIMVVAVAVILFLVTRSSVARPIEELARSVRDVASGDLRSRVPVRRSDELGRLAQQFNGMVERLEATRGSLLAEQEERRRVEASLREAERLAAIGRFAAGLAHEIGTPLNVISGRAELLLRRGGSEPEQRNLRIIATQIDRIARIVRRMLDFARAREPNLAPTALPEVLKSVIELMEQRFDSDGITPVVACRAGTPEIVADADQLQEVFLNLATNAADAMPDGGTLRIAMEPSERAHPEQHGKRQPFVAIRFEDDGCGIRAEDLDRVFDPFFTTKEIGKGTGLGLSVSYGIVREHGGWIEIESVRDRGTRVTVYLPVLPAATSPVRQSA